MTRKGRVRRFLFNFRPNFLSCRIFQTNLQWGQTLNEIALQINLIIKVQRADLTCDVIKKVAPFVLSKLWILVADWSMGLSRDTFLIKLRLYVLEFVKEWVVKKCFHHIFDFKDDLKKGYFQLPKWYISSRSLGNIWKCKQIFWTLSNSFFHKLYHTVDICTFTFH